MFVNDSDTQMISCNVGGYLSQWNQWLQCRNENLCRVSKLANSFH